MSLYFEEFFNITYILSVLVCFQLWGIEKSLLPRWLQTKAMVATGAWAAGRVSGWVGAQLLWVPHLGSSIRIVSFSHPLPSLWRTWNSPVLHGYTKRLSEKELVSPRDFHLTGTTFLSNQLNKVHWLTLALAHSWTIPWLRKRHSWRAQVLVLPNQSLSQAFEMTFIIIIIIKKKNYVPLATA